MVKNLSCNTGDAGSIPGQGTEIPHAMGQLSLRAATTEPTHHNYRARMPQLQSPHALKPMHHNYRAHTLWSPCATAREKPTRYNKEPACLSEEPAHHSERSHEPQLRPDAAKKGRKEGSLKKKDLVRLNGYKNKTHLYAAYKRLI